MRNREVYEYAFIRFVPRVERGEFINVGVLVFCKRKNYLGMKYFLDMNRMRALSVHTDLAVMEEYLLAWNLIVQGKSEGEPIAKLDKASRFRWLTATKSTIIQCSKVHPGLCDDPDKVLQDLFAKYVI